MAKAVEQALEEKRHLIVEAGTGTGKTLAYLLPSLRSGKRVIISTGTKNLQEQLFYKDVPFLKEHLGDLKVVCYMKGRNNYLCRKKLYELRGSAHLEWTGRDRSVSRDRGLGQDHAERATSLSCGVAGVVAGVGQTRRPGRYVPRPEVHVFRSLLHHRDAARALESDIIIVNHHLFFADLAIKMAADEAPDAGVLPDAAAVIFDEAHELEEVASSYFGVSVSTLRMEELARDWRRRCRRRRRCRGWRGIKSLGCASARNSFSRCCRRMTIGSLSGATGFSRRTWRRIHGADERSRTIGGRAEHGQSKPPEEAPALIRRVNEIAVQLSFIMESEDRNTVFWIERRGEGKRTDSSFAERSMCSCRPRRLMFLPSFASAI